MGGEVHRSSIKLKCGVWDPTKDCPDLWAAGRCVEGEECPFAVHTCTCGDPNCKKGSGEK